MIEQSTNPKVTAAAQEVLMLRKKYTNVGVYRGVELEDTTCKEVPEFPGITSLGQLYAVLRHCWQADTAYKSCQKDWKPQLPAYGQCAITAALVYDMFGFQIYRLGFAGGGSHYYNQVAIDGINHWVDITSEQMDSYTPYKQGRKIQRQRTCQTGNTRMRYVKLQKNIMEFLSN